MIDPADIDRKSQRLLKLAREKFGVKAETLEVAMRKIGRRVPKQVQAQARVIVLAQQQAGHPKLMLQTDAQSIEAAYEAVHKRLKEEDTADRRKGAILGTLGALSFNLIALCALLLGVLVWRGFL
ncbi:hypothetical protein [Shimia sp.]|uniref:hypothetical protein n=1 Tax=Shimia sp. TaxID=1954381 RepID=UPI0032993A57